MLALATGAQTLCPPALPFSFLDKHASILAHKMLPTKVLELDCVNDLASRTQSRQCVCVCVCVCARAGACAHGGESYRTVIEWCTEGHCHVALPNIVQASVR